MIYKNIGYNKIIYFIEYCNKNEILKVHLIKDNGIQIRSYSCEKETAYKLIHEHNTANIIGLYSKLIARKKRLLSIENKGIVKR